MYPKKGSSGLGCSKLRGVESVGFSQGSGRPLGCYFLFEKSRFTNPSMIIRPLKAEPFVLSCQSINGLATNPSTLSPGHSFRMTGALEESASAFEKAIKGAPDSILAQLGLAGPYSLMGREKEARAEADEVLKINPRFSLDNYAKLIPYRDQSDVDQDILSLRNAGLK